MNSPAMTLTEIVPSLDPTHGGPSVSVPRLADALARLGHAVDLFATRAPGTVAITSAASQSANVQTFPSAWPGSLQRSPSLRAHLWKTRSDVVHHHALWRRTLHYAHRAAKRQRAAFVISPRGMMSAWAWRHHARRKQFARALVHPGAFEAADGWHATSADEASEIRSLGFRQPICVAPNGIDAPRPETHAAAAAHWHEACPESATSPVAVFYSRFHCKKRVLELIDLWHAQGPRDWLLLIVGIPQEYSVEALRDYARRHAPSARVQIFSGIDRPPPYAIASLFLLPSHTENFGLVIGEALAWGVPALVTDTTPWRALSDDARGWCVPWSDFGDALRAATAESREQLHARGMRGTAWVLREFSWEKSARALADFYAELRRKP